MDRQCGTCDFYNVDAQCCQRFPRVWGPIRVKGIETSGLMGWVFPPTNADEWCGEYRKYVDHVKSDEPDCDDIPRDPYAIPEKGAEFKAIAEKVPEPPGHGNILWYLSKVFKEWQTGWVNFSALASAIQDGKLMLSREAEVGGDIDRAGLI